jgi:hypothetical protein
MHKEFSIACSSLNWRIDHPSKSCKPSLRDKSPDFFNCLDMESCVSHDAATSYVLPAEFELGFDKSDHRSALFQQSKDGRENQGQGNEAYINHGKAKWCTEVAWTEVASINSLVKFHPWICAQLPVHLVMPNIDGYNACRTMLQEAIRESTGGCAHIKAAKTRRIDFESLERGF